MADALRGSMDAGQYKHVVLGLILLKYISDAFKEEHAKLVADKASGVTANLDLEIAMTINQDGRFCLYYWLNKYGENEPDQIDTFDTSKEAEDRAQQTLEAGRYKYIWMGIWNDSLEDWNTVAEFGGLPEDD